jgi:hypothetical protein
VGLCLLALCLFLPAGQVSAGEKIVAGPKGGRVLESEPHLVEFLVTKDRRVEVTFYDARRQIVAPGERVVAVMAEPKAGRVAIPLENSPTGFLSTTALPTGEPYRVVVQVRENAGARPRNFRLELNLEPCGGCKLAEYACTCATH